MSTHVVTEFQTKPGSAQSLVAFLERILPESLRHDGCEGISIQCNQDDRDNVVAFTTWAARHNYEDYLAWRTDAGFTDTVEEMLTTPMSIRYFDEVVSEPAVKRQSVAV
jgi:quinol monooxygenase YgiN